jgi:CheY-like chemotaxis protein
MKRAGTRRSGMPEGPDSGLVLPLRQGLNPSDPGVVMKKVLLVDDDDLQIRLLEFALQDRYQLASASNGREAVDRAAAWSPDLILMDINMPEMNGHEACRSLRQEGSEVPVIFISQLDSLEDQLAAYDAGADDFFAKPFRAEEVVGRIETSLRRQERLARERDRLQELTHQSLTDIYFLGQIVHFLNRSHGLRTLESLAASLFTVLGAFGLRATLFVQGQGMTGLFFDDDVDKPVERALLESLRGEQRLLEFGRRRCAFNWPAASLLVKTMPVEELQYGKMKDYLAYLMDGVQACIEGIAVEHRLRETVVRFRAENEAVKLGIFALIEGLEGVLEQEFSLAGLDEGLSLEMERRLLGVVRTLRTEADRKLTTGYAIEGELDALLQRFAETPPAPAEPDDVVLF